MGGLVTTVLTEIGHASLTVSPFSLFFRVDDARAVANSRVKDFGVLVSPGNTVYIGELSARDHKKHGIGVEYDRQALFIGSWQDNKRHGFGQLQWPQGVSTFRDYHSGQLTSEQPNPSAQMAWCSKILKSIATRVVPVDFQDLSLKEVLDSCLPSAAEDSASLATYNILSKALTEASKLKISEIFLAGSLGKGTRVKDESELEIVVVLNEFDAKNYGEYCKFAEECLASHGSDFRRTPSSLQFFAKDDLEVEIRFGPALTKEQLIILPPSSPEDFSFHSRLALQVDFVKKQHPLCLDLIRLIKFWRRTVVFLALRRLISLAQTVSQLAPTAFCACSKMSTNPSSRLADYFQQEEPRLGNQFTEDTGLLSYLRRVVPGSTLAQVEQDLTRFGQRVTSGGDILAYGRQAESYPPKLINYNAFGRRVDKIEVADGWNKLQDVSAEEGLIALGYERPYGEWSRLIQMIKFYMFTTSAAIFDCPLAMTDGAVRLLELNMGAVKDAATRQKLQSVWDHLMSRDPKKFWTTGQWMTERTGGSDVGGTETKAKKNPDGTYSLTGFKFFTSATTSDGTFLLARIVDDSGNSIAGSAGLSVFYMDMRKEDGTLNNIIIHRLKNKFGTKALPTAELELVGSKAYLVGAPGTGVKVISSILNITRIHNAISMVGGARRAVAIARDYASRRKVFGNKLCDQPLHLATLADMECELRGALYLTLDVCVLQGLVEVHKATEKQNVLVRLLTPLCKLYTAKQGIQIASESMESLGGTGYMEDSDLPRILRDVQVGAIWEGTTNVLSLDTLRPIMKENALPVFIEHIKCMLPPSIGQILPGARENILGACDKVAAYASKAFKTGSKAAIETNARLFAYSLTRIYIAATALVHAEWASKNAHSSPSDPAAEVLVARYWCLRQPICVVPDSVIGESDLKAIQALAMDRDPRTGHFRGSGDVDAQGKPRARY
eukprot:TRINITY_DN622_c0_g1_i8.p1 TRINITY_DN622_c0_g1~~TRINITY_DN622_c0_g1_i8.p1  ORF type:complete len:952 (+),score=155.20 TRINITY_DN622_c0_g1_i8:2977-5832(+)